MDVSRKLRWGILSTAKIGVDRVIPAIVKSNHGQVCAIASRDLVKAEGVAERFNIPRAFGSYEALLADPDIDAIYNPTPNTQHIEWTLKANAAGKHVLCEKPMAIDGADAERLRKARPDRLIMEAFMVRFHERGRSAMFGRSTPHSPTTMSIRKTYAIGRTLEAGLCSILGVIASRPHASLWRQSRCVCLV
jgi:predicted dehydrogenase